VGSNIRFRDGIKIGRIKLPAKKYLHSFIEANALKLRGFSTFVHKRITF
jgi:hypothetical protein